MRIVRLATIICGLGLLLLALVPLTNLSGTLYAAPDALTPIPEPDTPTPRPGGGGGGGGGERPTPTMRLPPTRTPGGVLPTATAIPTLTPTPQISVPTIPPSPTATATATSLPESTLPPPATPIPTSTVSVPPVDTGSGGGRIPDPGLPVTAESDSDALSTSITFGLLGAALVLLGLLMFYAELRRRDDITG